MNNNKAKKIRSIINPDDKISRRVYRRSKKQYTKTPKNLKLDFLVTLEKLINKEKD